jgi:hypothetical protein
MIFGIDEFHEKRCCESLVVLWEWLKFSSYIYAFLSVWIQFGAGDVHKDVMGDVSLVKFCPVKPLLLLGTYMKFWSHFPHLLYDLGVFPCNIWAWCEFCEDRRREICTFITTVNQIKFICLPWNQMVKAKFHLTTCHYGTEGSTGIALLFNLSARWGWVVNATAWSLYPREWHGIYDILYMLLRRHSFVTIQFIRSIRWRKSVRP